MKKKTLWFDLETTGTDSKYHGIVQFAGLMDIDGEVIDQLNLKMQPHPGAVIEQSALEVTGVSAADIAGYMPNDEAYRTIRTFFDKHVEKYDPSDKMYPAGYNVQFDLGFLQEMFKRFDKYGMGSYFNWRSVDPLPLIRLMDYKGTISLPDYKLATVCAHYGITIDKAHDALSDVQATRKLTKKLLSEAFSL